MTKITIYSIILFVAFCVSGCSSDVDKSKSIKSVLGDCQGKAEVVYHIGTLSEFLEVSCTEYKHD